MGAPQKKILAYGQPAGFAGLCTHKLDSWSAMNAEVTANIGFGLGVKPGVKLKEALLPTANNSVLLGIVEHHHNYAPGTFGALDQAGTPPGLIPKTFMEVVRVGRIWVVVDGDTAITPNVTRAYWRFETDGANNTLVGTFRHSDDGHVVDTRKQLLFVSGIYDAADILTGVSPNTKIAEVAISALTSA